MTKKNCIIYILPVITIDNIINMKSDKIINKIINQIDTHAEIMKNLLFELDESLEKEENKLKEDVAKKIASSFNLDIDQVLKKVIKRKKKSVELEDQIEDMENESLNIESDIIPVYKKIMHEDKEYYYHDKQDGIVFEMNEDTLKTVIVGYIDYNTKTIKFM